MAERTTRKTKRKAPVRRKPATKVEVPSSVQEPLQPRFVEVAVHKKTRPSLAVVVGQLLFGALVVVGVFVVWQQVATLKQQVSQQKPAVDEAVNQELAEVKSRLDSLISEWGKQKEQEEIATTILTYTNADLGLALSYPATLGGVLFETPATIRFSANPDIWLVKDRAVAECETPLDMTVEGYCDVVETPAGPGKQFVYPERTESGSLARVLMEVRWDDWRAFVDLGTPPVPDRNIFVPADDGTQQDALVGFYRNILKKEALPDIVSDSLMRFVQVVSGVRFTS